MTDALSSMRKRPLLHAVLLISALVGCGGDGGGNGGGGSDGGDGSGDGSGDGGDWSDDGASCAEDDEVLAPTKLSDGSVIYRMALDGDDLYFASLDRLYRVPVSGGTAEELYFRDLAIAVPFHVRADDILILAGDELLSLPKAGGDTRVLATLADVPSGALDGRVDILFDGDEAYYKTSSGGFGDEPEMVTFYALDLESGESTMLAAGPIGAYSPMVKAGDGLFVSSDDPAVPPPADDEFKSRPDVLYRIPTAGGEPEIVPTEFGGELRFTFNPMGADDSALFLNASPIVPENNEDFGVFKLHGIYRVPVAGGDATQMFEAFASFNSTIELDRVGDESYIRVVGTTDDVYSVPTGSDTATKLFCVGSGDSHAMAVNAEAAYVALFDSETENSRIIRIDL